MPVEKSAGAVVFHRQPSGGIKYLVIRNSENKTWGFPKGLIDNGESLESAAMREIKEESGLRDLKFIEGFKETIKYFLKVKFDYQIQMGMKLGETALKFVTYFLAETKDKEAKLSFEHDEYQWLELDEACRLLSMKQSKEVLKKAHEFLGMRKA